jgi:hypothetical protein
MRRVGMVDLDTGEVLSGVPVWVGAKARSPYGDRWIAVSQDFLEELAARRDVHGETLRVFVFLNARLDFNNLIQVPMIEIAERLGMKPPNVRRAMKKPPSATAPSLPSHDGQVRRALARRAFTGETSPPRGRVCRGAMEALSPEGAEPVTRRAAAKRRSRRSRLDGRAPGGRR